MNKIEQLRISGQLHSPKGVALAIMEISQHEDVTLDEIAKVAQIAPALAGQWLHQCMETRRIV